MGISYLRTSEIEGDRTIRTQAASSHRVRLHPWSACRTLLAGRSSPRSPALSAGRLEILSTGVARDWLRNLACRTCAPPLHSGPSPRLWVCSMEMSGTNLGFFLHASSELWSLLSKISGLRKNRCSSALSQTTAPVRPVLSLLLGRSSPWSQSTGLSPTLQLEILEMPRIKFRVSCMQMERRVLSGKI